MFELADLWTNSVKAAEYVRFLKLVHRRATRLGQNLAGPPRDKPEWAHRWPREPQASACRQWLAAARARWLDDSGPIAGELVPVPHSGASPDSGKRSPRRKMGERQLLKGFQNAARRGMMELGAVPGADDVLPPLGLHAFKVGLKLLPTAQGGEHGFDPRDAAFAHALFRVCDANQDGLVSLEDLVEALSSRRG